jgi:hypothetical protein
MAGNQGLELKIASITKPCKWTKGTSSGLGSTEKFRSAQNTAQFHKKVDQILQTEISSLNDICSSNEIAFATFNYLASQVATQKSG